MITRFSGSKLSYTQRYRQMMAGSAYVPPAYELISTTVLSSSAASVTFSGLGTTAAQYKHLQLRAVTRTDTANTTDNSIIRFNSDSGANYSGHTLRGNGTATSSTSGVSRTYATFLSDTAATAASGSFAVNIIDILDFSQTTKYKTVRQLNGETIGPNIFLQSGLWMNTAAITQIDISPLNTGNLIAGSRFSLYGVRG